jgi:uncharacterized protein
MPADTGPVSQASVSPLSPTPRSTPNRHRERARSDRAELYALLDSCLICHLGIAIDGAPVVLPTGYGRDGDTLYLHGSTGSVSMINASGGAPVSVAITRLDGIVYARSAFHHSINYVSAVIHGAARLVTEPDEKAHGLRILTDHLAPGSWDATRQPTKKELAQTAVLAVPLHDASVKMRNAPPNDDEDDVTANHTWAGVLPVHLAWGTPEPCPLLPAGMAIPERVSSRR